MKALSVRQPWAWALVAGYKDVENRRWTTEHRGPLAIHATRRHPDPVGLAYLQRAGIEAPGEFDRGAVVGVVILRAIVRNAASEWAEPGLWHWLVGGAAELARPIPTRGHMALFDVTLPAPSMRRRATSRAMIAPR